MSEAKALKKMHLAMSDLEQSPPGMTHWKVSTLLHYQASSGVDCYDRILAKNVINRCDDPFLVMEKLLHLAKPGCQLIIDVPFGSHDRAEEFDCKRRIFVDTLRVFEPHWRFARRTLYCDGLFFSSDIDMVQLGMAVAQLRNVVKGFACEFIAQKPIPEGYKSSDPLTAFKMI